MISYLDDYLSKKEDDKTKLNKIKEDNIRLHKEMIGKCISFDDGNSLCFVKITDVDVDSMGRAVVIGDVVSRERDGWVYFTQDVISSVINPLTRELHNHYDFCETEKFELMVAKIKELNELGGV